MRVLCTADVHIGRASRLDAEMPQLIELSALGAWERIVNAAIDGEAAAVVIAGDLFDSLSAQYQTRPRVERAFKRLCEKNIPAIAVAGNHDCNALPTFKDAHPGLVHLFGSRKWSEYDIGSLRFVGRSFCAEYERDSLLKNFDLPPSDLTTIGVVHADINSQSQYGATPLNSFAGRGVAAWVVGHVHDPRCWPADAPVAYPGSPQALDWGETGVHGFRWLTIENGRARFTDVVPVSTVRYEYTTVELGPESNLDTEIAARSQDCRSKQPSLECVQFRVNLRLSRDANRQFPEEATPLGGDVYSVQSKIVEPEVDLIAEATQPDARGQVARLLLGLQGSGEMTWQQHASALVTIVDNEMANARRALNLPAGEEVESLRRSAGNEAKNALERALKRVLTSEATGR